MKKSKLSVLWELLGLVRPLRGWMALAVFMGTMGFLAAQFIPILGAYGILRALELSVSGTQNALSALAPFGWGLVGLALFRAVSRYAEQRSNHYIAFTLLALVRDKVFGALRKLCPAKLEGRDKGDLISLITADVELLEVFYAHTISPICIALVTELIMCLYIGHFHWSLGLLALTAFLCVGVLLPLIIFRRNKDLGEKLRGQSADLSAYMLESIRGLDETIQYGGGKERLAELGGRTEQLSGRQEAMNRMSGLNLALANSMILLFDALMLCLAGALCLKGAISSQAMLLSVVALMSSFGPVTALAALGTTLETTAASGARVLAVLEEEPETEEIQGKEKALFGPVRAEHVGFSYGNEEVLEDFSMEIPEKKILGLVGPSGCGKSTILKLLMRFWRVEQGRIRIGGRAIEDINTADLREMESYMTQETRLFKGTIEENIRIGRWEASREEVEEACKKASLHDFIMSLPRGYETPLGELGESLSGGERQRIGLARAFLHNAPLMLLDEPTSNLDSLNEAVILKALKEEAIDKTVVLVSHRPSTVRIADRVLELKQKGAGLVP